VHLLLLLLIASSGSLVSGGMIDLVCAVEVENVGRISVPEDHTFFLKLTCTTCRSEFPNAVAVSSDMVVEGVRGSQPPPLTRAHAPAFPSACPWLRRRRGSDRG